MTKSSYEVSSAAIADIPGIVELQERNLRHNGGALSVRFTPAWFAQAMADMPIIVSRCDGRLVGYAVSTPLTGQAHEPIIQAMLRAYSGSPGAYNYGPICVAEDHRGHGLARAMFRELKARLPGREGLTFIRADNTASREVHAKMGMREVADFTLSEAAYVVVAYQG